MATNNKRKAAPEEETARGPSPTITLQISTSVTIRLMLPHEVEAAAQVCFHSFKAFNDSVGLPCEFGGVVPVDLMKKNQAHPNMACFVAVMEPTGEVVGTNCVDLRDQVGAIGPIAVAPAWWGRKIGEALMNACIEAAREAGKPKTMLMQVASNTVSYSLYVRLGFVPFETCVNLAGVVDIGSCPHPAGNALSRGTTWEFRKLTPADLSACCNLYKTITGDGEWSREGEIRDMIEGGGATVYGIWRDNDFGESLVAFTTGTVLGGFIVAAEHIWFKLLLWDMSQILLTKLSFLPKEMNFYLPARLYPKLLPWLLKDAKLKVVRQVTLMKRGEGRFPVVSENVAHKGVVYCPSICY